MSLQVWRMLQKPLCGNQMNLATLMAGKGLRELFTLTDVNKQFENIHKVTDQGYMQKSFKKL